jgi:nucleotide-binding universal stress UspA family protein
VNVVPSSLITPNEMGFIEPHTIEQLHQHAQSLLRCMRDRAQDVPSDEILRDGVVCEEIVAAAREWNADLIVVGNHSRSLLERLLLSNTTNGVLHRPPCPVLVVSTSAGIPSRPVENVACEVCIDESSKHSNRRLTCENVKQICH